MHVLSTQVDYYRSVFHCLFCGTPHFLQHLHLLCCMNRSENFPHGKEFQMKMKRLSLELLIANETSASVSLLSFSAQELWFQNVKKEKKKISHVHKNQTLLQQFCILQINLTTADSLQCAHPATKKKKKKKLGGLLKSKPKSLVLILSHKSTVLLHTLFDLPAR